MQKSKKLLMFVDHTGNFSEHNTEEILASKINKWKGWKCSAGASNLHITSDGNIYGATCKVGGFLGNVFDSGVQFPDLWVTCTKEWCMCGADMAIPKYRPESELKSPITFSEKMVEPVTITYANTEKAKHYPLSITWDIGRRCNYQCDYCPPSTSNTYESHKSFGSLKLAVDQLLQNFCKMNKAQWIFTGGEPTVNPAFIEIVRYLRSLGHYILVQSNGSRDSEYFQELIELSHLGFSVHFSQFNREKFVNTCRSIVEKKKSLSGHEKKHFSIRLMVEPGKLEEARELKLKLNEISEGEINSIVFSPLYQKNNGDQLMEYKADELAAILANS